MTNRNKIKDPFGATRRGVLLGMAAAPFALPATKAGAAGVTATCFASQQALGKRIQQQLQTDGTKIVLLGTGGGPIVGTSRLQSCVALCHRNEVQLLDCGIDVSQRLAEAGFHFHQIQNVFLSLQRPDHVLGYGPFLVEGWIQGLRPEMQVFGPPPLTQMTRDYLNSMRSVTDAWSRDFHLPAFRGFATTEVSTAETILKTDTFTVRTILLDHPTVVPAIGYRFDFPDRSVVFAPDTAPVPELVDFAKGADVLIHDAMYVPGVKKMIQGAIDSGQPISFDAYFAHMMADHTPVERAAELAQAAEVKTLVLYHISPVDVPVSNDEWLAAAKAFKGKTVIAQDLMVL